MAELMKLKGIGRWTAEIYLMFCLGRPDIIAGGRSCPARGGRPGETQAQAAGRSPASPHGPGLAALAQRCGAPALALLRNQRQDEEGQRPKGNNGPMRDILELSGPMQKPQSGGKPKQLVVLLHGYGSDGNDLIGLAPHWAPLIPDAEFVAPNAPYPCEMAPFGHQWFSLADDSQAARLAGVRAAATSARRLYRRGAEGARSR